MNDVKRRRKPERFLGFGCFSHDTYTSACVKEKISINKCTRFLLAILEKDSEVEME
jgi:hypothetical protein